MRKLDPACKFIALLVPTFFLAAKPNALWNLAVFAVCFLLLFFSRVRLRLIVGIYAPVFLMAAAMFMTGYRFPSASSSLPVNAASLNITSSAVYNGLLMGSRVLAYAAVGVLFALTTDRIHMVKSFRRHFRLPQSFAYGLLAAWGIFPHMAQEYRRARAALRMRGRKALPVSPAVLKPLLIKSVRWSEELAIAMESKGFSGAAKRTEYLPCRIRVPDLLLLLVGWVVLPVLILCL